MIKEFDNSVIFPNEGSGKFNPSFFSAGCTYEVEGNTKDTTNAPPIACPVRSPFGAYPKVTESLQLKHNSCVPHPPPSRKSIKKTIPVINLSARDSNRPSSSKTNGLMYTVVTHVIVNLNSSAGECTVGTVAEKVKAQVGFDTILLDSKLYPVLENDATSGIEFWKSTRKIMAASRSLYERLGGAPSNAELLSQVDDAEVVFLEPSNKKVKTSNSLADSTLNSVAIDKLTNIDKKLDEVVARVGFLDDIRKVFECVVCRCPVKSPVVARCCQRIVGCRACVERWFTTNTRCPLCSVSGRMDDVIPLKGIDDFVAFFRPESPDLPAVTATATAATHEDSDDDFL